MVVVSGDAGVGKSRLLSELSEYAAFKGCSILKSEGTPFSQDLPYHLVLRLVRQALGQLDHDDLTAIRGELGPIHPATSELLPGFWTETRDDTQYLNEDSLRFRIFEDFGKLVGMLAERTPIMLLLENLQWAAPTDMDLILFIARSNPTAPILLAGTIPSATEAERKTLSALLSVQGSIPVTHVALRNLSPAETENLVMFTLRDPDVPADLQKKLYRHSGGNPMFLRELLLALWENGSIRADRHGILHYDVPRTLEVPGSLSQTITQKLSGMDAGATRVLEIASLTPDYFELDLLEEISDSERMELADMLDSCCRRGILREERNERGRLCFRFALNTFRSYLREQLSETLASIYHGKMASYLERKLQSGENHLLGAVAHHYMEAGDTERSSLYCLRAAESALRRAARRNAMEWLEKYISITEHLDEPAEKVAWGKLQLGKLYGSLGEPEKGRGYIEAALSEASGEVETQAMVELGENEYIQSNYAEAKAAFEWVLGNSSDPAVRARVQLRAAFITNLEGKYEEALEVLSRAWNDIESIPAVDNRRESLLALYHIRRGDILTNLRSDMSPGESYEEALRLCRKQGDRLQEAKTLNNMSELLQRSGDYERALAVLKEVEDINARFDDALGLAIVCYNIAEIYAEMNQAPMAREYYARYLSLSEKIDNRLGMGYGNLGLGMLYLQEGSFDRSRHFLLEAAETFSELGSKGLEAESRLFLSSALVRLDLPQEASAQLTLVDVGALTAKQRTEYAYVEGLLELHGSEAQGSDASLRRAVERFRMSVENTEGLLEHVVARRYLDLADALERAGAQGEALRALEEGRRRVEEMLSRIGSPQIRRNIADMSAIRQLLGTE
jgi:predicted ATPase